MDNDSWIKKKLVSQYKKIKMKIDYTGTNIVSNYDGNVIIEKQLKTSEPFMCVRLGAVEARCIDKWISGKKFNEDNIDQIYYAAGVFPQNINVIERFCESYIEAIKETDILGVWGVKSEKNIINKYCPSAQLVPLRSIEPYYYNQPWSKSLEGKKVLIIHPFIESIMKQYKKRSELFENTSILPTFEQLSFIKAIQSNAGGKSNFNSWFEALEMMKKQVDNSTFDVAIIGAGAYGLPLASHIKSIGKQAIQMGGSTQIMFGIKGKRWDEHPEISGLYNDKWIRPSSVETPPNISKVEGGSYW